MKISLLSDWLKTYPKILWSLKGLLAHPALELAFAEMVVVDVALKGPGVGGCLVAYVAAVLVARRLVHRVHVLLQSGEMAQPGATYLARLVDLL